MRMSKGEQSPKHWSIAPPEREAQFSSPELHSHGEDLEASGDISATSQAKAQYWWGAKQQGNHSKRQSGAWVHVLLLSHHPAAQVPFRPEQW